MSVVLMLGAVLHHIGSAIMLLVDGIAFSNNLQSHLQSGRHVLPHVFEFIVWPVQHRTASSSNLILEKQRCDTHVPTP